MTDLRQTAGAVGVILLLTALLTAAFFAVFGGIALLVDWIVTAALPAARLWADSNPDARDILTLGVLALLALAAAEYRRR